MAAKYISELTAVTNLEDTDVLVIDDGSHNYKITWGSLKARLKTVSAFTVDNIAGTIKITAADGTEYTVTPHDPTKQNNLTFDAAPTANSTNPVTSGGVYTSLDNKVDKETGKGLSTNDFTTEEKTKLAGIESGAQVNPSAASTDPLMDGTASAGSSSDYARGDHVHPTDTSREEDGLGITGATAGQSVRVKTVDGNGKPTEFEAFTLEDGTVVQNGRLVRQTSNSFSMNGIYDTTTNNSVTVAVPNTYSSADAGKVVSGGTLVPQFSSSTTINGLYDTTLVNAFEVAVPTYEQELNILLGLASGPFSNSSVTTTRSAMFASTLITEADFPNVTYIASYAFANCSRLSSISFPLCEDIANSAFYSSSRLTEAIFPNCTDVGVGAFAGCRSLQTASFPLCTNLSASAFVNCSSLREIYFPNCISIGLYAFSRCTTLTSVVFPSCTTIRTGAFGYCSALSQISFPECTSVELSAFTFCNSLTEINLPKCRNISGSAFSHCGSLATVSLPLCSSVGGYAFTACPISYIYLPSCTNIATYGLAGCNKLSEVSLPACTSIGNYAFSSCFRLEKLYLLGSSVPNLVNSSAFIHTPIMSSTALGYFGSIYVLSSLYSAFLAATNWSYFSSRFVSM